MENNHIDKELLIEYLNSVPYQINRKTLYSAEELFDVYDPNDAGSFMRCYDTRVYNHEVETGKLTDSPLEMAARGFHDFNIRIAMRQFLDTYNQHKVVGIMGGHNLGRDTKAYRQAVEVSKRLTEDGFLMISGGGPGAMEATHLGAWLAGRGKDEVDQAIAILSKAPLFQDKEWFEAAMKVRALYPLATEYKSLAIPTWYYGHEPPTVFATHIAKLFENSIREDALLTEAYGGLIFMEGSAGTLQEIFQEAVQNHYMCLGYPSPMIFVNKHFWTDEVPVYPFMQFMIEKGRYKNLLLHFVDEADEIIDVIKG